MITPSPAEPKVSKMKIHLKPKFVKHGKKWMWSVDGRRIGLGRRFFKTQEEASKYIADARADINGVNHTLHSMTNREIYELIMARERLNEVGGSIHEAVSAYIFGFGPPEKTVSIKEALQQCMAEKASSGKSRRYVLQLKYNVGALAKHVKPNTMVANITPEMINSWVSKNLEWSLNTRKSKLIDISSFFSFCVRKDWIRGNPCSKIEIPRRDNRPPGILTVDQAEALLKAAYRLCPDFIPYLTLGMFCGVRREELYRLTWHQVNLAQSWVEIPAAISKTRRRRIVGISKNAKAWLELGGELPPVNWQRNLYKVRTEIGMKAWPQNALRHSFASYHLAKHKSPDKTAHELGHRSTELLYHHYRELVLPSEAKRFWQIYPLTSWSNPELMEEKLANEPAAAD